MSRRLAFAAPLLLAGCAVATPPATSPAGAGPNAPADGALGAPAPFPAAPPGAGAELRTQTKPLPADLAAVRGLRGVTISRDGKRIAYVVRAPRFDPKAVPSPEDAKAGWSVDQQVWVVDRAGGKPRQLTFGDDPASQPRFSPDGQRLAFLRKKANKPTIFVIALDGGEPQAIKLGDHEPRGFDWAPDGKALSFTAARPATAEAKAERWRRGGARAYDREWEQTHLFVAPLDGSAEPRHINQGADNVVGYQWSPDGKRFALVVSPSAEPVEVNCHHKLVLIDANGGAPPQVLDQSPGTFVIHQLAFSPDGQRLAYAVSSRGGMSHIDELRVRAPGGGPATNAAAKLDPDIRDFAWGPGGKTLLVSALVRTASKLYRLPVDGSSAAEVPVGKRVLLGLEADRGGRYLVTASSTPTTPAEPTLIDAERGTAASLATINPQVREWAVARNEVVRWKNKEGVELEGVLTVTGHERPGAPPLVVIPHGGPDSVSLEGFNLWAQFFAARGYSVFEPNYRGGLAYGRAFYEANRGRLGEIEQADIESGVDALVASGKADAARLFFGSWSWGGYLSAWTLGHTDRYRAIMVGAGVVDSVVQYVTSDINHGTTADWEYKGRPWSTNPAAFERSNPARFLGNAKTPTLIIHGENDERVPFVNAQILYRALRDRDVPVTMWAYPREPHGFQEPAHIQHMFERWASFFDEQLGRPREGARLGAPGGPFDRLFIGPKPPASRGPGAPRRAITTRRIDMIYFDGVVVPPENRLAT